MSIKLIKDAMQWNEHRIKIEQDGRTTRHNEYDAGTEIEKNKRVRTTPNANSSPTWGSLEVFPELTSDDTSIATQEAAYDEDNSLELPLPIPIPSDVDAIVLIGHLYATKSGLCARIVLALTKSNTVRLFRHASFSALFRCERMEKQVECVLGEDLYTKAFELHDRRDNKLRPVYRGFPIDEWVIRHESDRRLLENGEDLASEKCSSLIQDRVQSIPFCLTR